MIGKAKSISHGINDIRYISGESRNKEYPELIYHVKDNLLPCELDAQGVWDMMKAHAPMKNNVIRIEISPAKEHTKDFTMKDWQQLWNDFVREYDKIEMADEDGKVYSHKTNIADSIYTVWLHLESDSRIPHLHAAVCRKDRDGRTNNDHKIHIRAHDAAQEVAIKRGWMTAMEIHNANADEVAGDLMDILRSMPSWSWNDYVARVRAKGYTLMVRSDKKDAIKGYTIGKGKAKFKASELGKGRKLMASKIEQTWQKLHGQSETKSMQPVGKNGTKTVTPVIPVMVKPKTQPMRHPDKSVAHFADYSSWHENTSKYELTHDGKTFQFYIPDDVMQVFNDKFDYRETANWKELIDMAVALFVGLAALDTVSTGCNGGGGSSNDNEWRDKKDEDEIERARRCVHVAAAHLGKKRDQDAEDKDIPMANKKYDYSDEMMQSTETAETSDAMAVSAATAEETRRQRLEQRNDALANEFRRLKPEIAEAYRLLNKLIEGIGAYAGTMINLHDLLKTSFPIRFTENDRQALLEEVNAIADNAISHIRRVREKADKDIRRNENRVSMTQVTFWCMIALLLILATFFALVIFANVKLIHSEVLSEIIIVYAGLIIITSSTVSVVFYKRKH